MTGMPTANTAPFSPEEASRATGARIALLGTRPARGVLTDSREELVEKIFVALRGERFDGHRFAETAAQAGAAMLVVDELGAAGLRLSELPTGVTVLVTPDTTTALGDLARFHRERWGKTVVGIAGSAGKTTTRAAVSRVLERLRPGGVCSTEGNFNNRIGVALTMLQLERNHELCVLELGTNLKGEVAELCRISRPDVGVLTLIDLEHTEGLGDLDGVEAEEGALLASLSEAGAAVGLVDDPRVKRQLEASPARLRLSYGESTEATVRVTGVELLSDFRTRVGLSFENRSIEFRSPLAGLAGALAAAAATCVSEAVCPGELSAAVLEAALFEAKVPGRAALVRLASGRLLLDDTYNSNPASVRLALDHGRKLAEKAGGRLLLVLGDMLELGELSASAHTEMGRWAAQSGAVWLGTVGRDSELAKQAAERADADRVRSVQPKAAASPLTCRHFLRAEEVGPVLIEEIRPSDVVVVKASRGVRAEVIVRYLQGSNLAGPPRGDAHRT